MTAHLSKTKRFAVRLAYRAGWLFFVDPDVIKRYFDATQDVEQGKKSILLKQFLVGATVDFSAIFEGRPAIHKNRLGPPHSAGG